MDFEVVGYIENPELIAAGPGLRVRAYLRKVYGAGRWRKPNGTSGT
jgi:hypothetical protein